MAIVSGGGITVLPQENLQGLFGGAGQVLQAINQVRAQTADKQRLDEFNRVLLGDTLPEGQAGPVRPGVTDPRERLNATLGLIPQLQLPRNQQIALEIAKIEEKAIPTKTAGADPVQTAIFTDAAGVKRKTRAPRSQIESNPNLDFPAVKEETPAQFDIIENARGDKFRVDLLNPEAPPVPIGIESPGEPPKVDNKPRDPQITLDILNDASGPVSAGRQFLNNVFGFAVPGQIAPDTETAKNRMRIFNQTMKEALLVNERGPRFEQEIINDIIVNPDKVFTDPDANKTKMLNLRNTLESRIQSNQDAINSGNITKKQIQDFTDQNNIMGGILKDIPLREVLATGRTGAPEITPLQIDRMSQGEAQQTLDSLTPEQVRGLPSSVKTALQRKLSQ